MANTMQNLLGEQTGHPRASQVAPSNCVQLSESQPSNFLFIRRNVIQSQHFISDHSSSLLNGGVKGQSSLYEGSGRKADPCSSAGHGHVCFSPLNRPNFCPHGGKVRFTIQVMDYQEDVETFPTYLRICNIKPSVSQLKEESTVNIKRIPYIMYSKQINRVFLVIGSGQKLNKLRFFLAKDRTVFLYVKYCA